MTRLDPLAIRQSLSTAANLERIEVFARIDSTNTYLKDQPSPTPGMFRVAIAEHQTAGRGRHDRAWISEPGKSLCLSLSYRFVQTPPDLPALTLALGVGVAVCLSDIGVASVSLKWPNDLLIGRDKLAGILTETQFRGNNDTTVIIGIGINIALPDTLSASETSDWADTATDLQSVLDEPPPRKDLSGSIIDALFAACQAFETQGFAAFVADFERFDALDGLRIVAETPDGLVDGIARGVDNKGALQIENDHGLRQVITGSIKHIGNADEPG